MKGGGRSAEELRRSLGEKKIMPLYLLFGQEDFLIEEAVRLILDHALSPESRGFNLDTLYGPESDARDVLEFASSYPMGGERRAVVVREADRLANPERLVPAVERPLASTCLILTSAKPDFRMGLMKAAREHAFAVEFRPMYENEIPAWIAARAGGLGKEITAEACQLVLSYGGRSLREIKNELEKLAVYVGDKKSIDGDDVGIVVGMSRQYNIFELQKVIGSHDLPRSMEIAERMLAAGDSPTGMVVMLTRYIQKLWLLQEYLREKTPEARLSTRLGVNPYFLTEYINAARRFSSAHLRSGFAALVAADEALKSSMADQRVTMTVLVYKLVTGMMAEKAREPHA